jgi:hypothetical protein
MRHFSRRLSPTHLGLTIFLCLVGSATSNSVRAHTDEESMLKAVVIKSTRGDLQGTADSASEGLVTSKQLQTRPLLRAGDLMEVVPGLVATQHSGEGKANQYFIRGFNLDHGTDFATYVDGVPINLPTHGHGQGYTDLYFVIPELVETIRYRKGPYYADDGDFSAAGSVRFRTVRKLNGPLGVIEAGQFGYARALGAGSFKLGENYLLLAAEQSKDNGPWAIKQDLRKSNLVARLSHGTESDGWQIGVNRYSAQWTATDQVPQRAIDSGIVSRFGSLDPTTGGKTERTGIHGEWATNHQGTQTKINAWATQYAFNLFSNFTYFTRGCDGTSLPSECNGSVAQDQIEQVDQRKSFGLSGSHSVPITLGSTALNFKIGSDLRRDNIAAVGLYDTLARERIRTIRNDKVRIDAISLWSQLEAQLLPTVRAVVGLRWDQRDFNTTSSIALNSGQTKASITSPKVALIYSPTSQSDFYINWGRGFHSNDARGSVIKVDPRDPTIAVQPATPLVRATGFEFGQRQKWDQTLSSTFALWQLSLDSELLFVGDAGTTEPTKSSVRRGLEITTNWRPSAHWEVDADLSLSRGRLNDSPGNNYIPGAMDKVLSVGATFIDGPWTIGSRVRYFGPRALVTDNSIRSAPSTTVNFRAGYKLSKSTEIALDVFNLFDKKLNDIEYAYSSRLPFEAPYSDASTPATRHIHPALPRTIRIGLKANF